MNLSWQAVVEKTVTGLGYELVNCERSTGGLLRVDIDKPLVDGQEPEVPVNVEDCERVNRQLQYVLEVENCDYQRLEVSTPGVERPLNKPADYARFAGLDIEITLREAFQGRKKYRGQLVAAEAAEGQVPAADAWRLIFTEGKQEQVLDFTLDELRSAKLSPALAFKRRTPEAGAGKNPKNTDAAAKSSKASKKKSNAKSRQSDEGPAVEQDDKVDGGLDQ